MSITAFLTISEFFSICYSFDFDMLEKTQSNRKQVNSFFPFFLFGFRTFIYQVEVYEPRRFHLREFLLVKEFRKVSFIPLRFAFLPRMLQKNYKGVKEKLNLANTRKKQRSPLCPLCK